ARESANDMMPDFGWQGRQPRAVQADGMINVSGKMYGPLSDDLLRKQVDVDIASGVVEVYYERELRARFDQATAEPLSLDDDAVEVEAEATSANHD
ncbi:MAG: hypothetical protein M3365_01525, partial [Gemmatimonadota bacterium]|nr:hypothetical protein [Gemmatimonadota bacterium]